MGFKGVSMENREKKYKINNFKPDFVKQMVRVLHRFDDTQEVEKQE